MRVWQRTCVVNGFQLRATSFDRLLYLYLHRLALMGAQDRRVYRKYILPGMNAVDIGANIGVSSLIFSDLVGPQGHVYTFEPDHLLFDSLVNNIRKNAIANIEPYNLALGAGAGRMMLHRSVFNSGDNRLSVAGGSTTLLKDDRVRVDKLDSVLEGYCIDFIKIDVQGWEMNVINGMRQMLDTNPAIIVYFEFEPIKLAQAGYHPVELLNQFKNHEFAIFKTEGCSEKKIRNFDKLTTSIKNGRFINLIAKHC